MATLTFVEMKKLAISMAVRGSDKDAISQL
jgi:hypothetical protein